MPSAIHPAPAPPGTTSPGGAARSAPADRYGGFRPEIQGLRALAVLLVVVYHVFLGRVSGGVDIFLLISAFFLTLSFTRKLEAGRPLALGRYWLHTFKRLLPLAALTVLGTLLLVELFHPEGEAGQWYSHALASILYVENWTLGFGAVDYYAADTSTASPFQHFWSLSVQGQVFLLWPLVFGGTWLLTRSGRRRPVPVLAVAFGAIFAASLAWSVHATATDQAFAYFDTRARLWEFALGSLLALALPYLNPPRRVRVLLGWAGLVSMVSVGVLVDVQGAFPGWIALWPLASAAAIVVAGQSGSPAGVDRLLSSRPLVRLGDASYALYLIHWPLLITWLVLSDRPMAGPRSGAAIVLLSLVLAVLATRWVENPLKRWAWPERGRRTLAVSIAVSLGLVALPLGAWHVLDERRDARIAAAQDVNNPGAAVLMPGFRFQGDPTAPTLPLPEDLPAGASPVGEPCPEDVALGDAYREFCHETVAQADPAKTVLVTGNSHMQHWLPALKPLAEANGWRLVVYLMPGCYYTTAEEQPASETCRRWFEGTDDVLEAVDPDLMFLQGTFTSSSGEFWKPGLEERVRELDARGVQVVGVRDVPRFGTEPGECAIEHGADAPECVYTHPMLGTPDPQAPLAQELERFSAVDMTDLVCPEEQCRPVVGNVYVYFDDDHLSRVYSASLAPMFAQRVGEALASDGVEAPALP